MAWEIFKSIPVILQEPGLRSRFYIVAQPSYLRFIAYVGHGTGFGSDATQVLIPYQQSEFDYSLYRYRFTILNYESYYNYLSINSTPTESQAFYGPMTDNPIVGTSQIKNATIVIERELKNSPPTWLVIPTQNTKKDQVVTLNLANYSSDADSDFLSYTATSSNTGIATATVSGNTLTLTGKTIGSATITVTVNDGKASSLQTFTLNVINTTPTVAVSSPSANVTVYENDLFNIAGTAADVNPNQSVTVYAQIDLDQRIVLGIGLSNAPMPFSKQLKFKAGKLFDGDTAITGDLTDGVPHVLKIWAQDSDGGQSITVERTFYVVPNRAPLLSVNPPTPSGIIDVDSFAINGTFEDADKNETTVSYRINGANPVQVASGISGTFDFTITLGALIVGENVITVEAIDSYGAKTTQTVKLRKNLIAVPMTKSVARYKIVPPSGTASEILVWVQRDAELTLKASASMTLAGEQESFAPMTLTVTENLQNGQVEDEFYLAAGEAKDTIVLQLELEKANPTANNAITLIMGVL